MDDLDRDHLEHDLEERHPADVYRHTWWARLLGLTLFAASGVLAAGVLILLLAVLHAAGLPVPTADRWWGRLLG